MKTIKSLLVLAAIVAASLLFAGPAQAGQSFNVTNWMAANSAISNWPTNVPNNGTNLSTGGKIDVHNNAYAYLQVSYQAITTNATTVGVSLIRSGADGPPQILMNSTNGQIYQNDWETTPQLNYSFPSVWGTNIVTFGTNLDRYALGEANWIGVYSVTNGANSVTNLTISLNGKIIPIRYP